MPCVEDVELLRNFAESGSGEAFAALVRRRAGLVYSVAVRHTRDASQADAVTQTVFLALARKASVLARRPALIGWLYRSARFAAIDAMRAERRRQARQQKAFTMEPLPQGDREPDWDKVRPMLDDILTRLNELDRNAIILRYVDQQPFAAIGSRLSLTENAARMRVERALEKMRRSLAVRGFASSAAALEAALAGQAGTIVPAGLATAAISQALARASSGGGIAGSANFLKIMSTIKAITIIACAVALVAIGVGIYQNGRLRESRSALIKMHEVQEDLRGSLRTVEGQLAGQKPLGGPGARPPAKAASGPLTVATARPQNHDWNLVAMTAVKDLRFAGREAPSAAIESLNWARERGDITEMGKLIAFDASGASKAAALLATLSADDRAKYGISTPEEMIAFFLCGMGSKFASIEELEPVQADDQNATISAAYENASGGLSLYSFALQNTGYGWKWVVPDSVIDGVETHLTASGARITGY